MEIPTSSKQMLHLRERSLPAVDELSLAPKISTHENSQFSQLDLLRAFAVLSVFIGHFMAVSPTNWNPGIFPRFGVIIFFVHTALVLMFSLGRLDRDGGGREALRFYVRRIFRIYPLSIACVLIVAAAHVPRWPPTGVVETATPAVLTANLLLVQNVIPLPSLTAPLWSLPFEIQMYLVLPLIYLLLKKRRVHPLYLYGAAALLLVLPIARLHLLLAYVPCFLGGVLAYYLFARVRPRFGWVALLAFLTLSCLLYSVAGNSMLAAVSSNGALANRVQMVWDWLFATVTGLSVALFREVESRHIRRICHEVAKYSYGIYLSHLPIMWLAFMRLSSYPRVVQWGTFVILSFIVPVIAYRYIEAPLIRVGGVVADRMRLPVRQMSNAVSSAS